jgi:RHS repeat-associated protein
VAIKQILKRLDLESSERPMSVQQPALLCQYRYDPLDRLINHTLPDTPTLQRFYCKIRLATEIQGAMQLSIVQHGDQLLAQQRHESDAVNNTLLATDQQRSVVDTLAKNSPKQSISYSPYGHRRPESGLASLLGFAGERPESVTGHYLLGNGYRAFNPVLMRFNSPDSLSPFGQGGFNSYGYCSGDPINFYDPTGKSKFGVAVKIGRWAGRARRWTADNNILAAKADATGVIVSNYETFLLRPGVDGIAAVKAMRKVQKLKSLASFERARNGKYLQDVKTAQNDRVKLLSYIKEYDPKHLTVYSFEKLSQASKGVFDPHVRFVDRPSVSAAAQYKIELDGVKNPNSRALFDEASRIRAQYFEGEDH